jgi:hypothetical protein
MVNRRNDAEGRAFLHLPAELVAPDSDMLVQDARATLLHNLTLHNEAKESGVFVSPVWENKEGVTMLRAAVVPPQVASRYFEGRGLASMRDATVIEMIADVLPMLLEHPGEASHALEGTHDLWFHEEAPVRSLTIPYKGHFKLLTLLLADLARKVGAGMNEIEWLTSVGVLDAFHDPSVDPPAEVVRENTKQKLAAMIAEEEAWMRDYTTLKN